MHEGAKRERLENLNARRHANMVKRRAVLDAWFAKERPSGTDTVDAWMVSLMDRTPLSNWGSGCNDDQLVILRKFLTAEALTAPKFNEVKSAIAEIESYAERRALNAAAICDLINKIPTAEASGAVGQRYFEVALKNGFEQSMEMPPLTLDEIGELENGGVRGSWWTEDTDKYVASLGHDWKLLYYWFRTQVIEKMAEAAYTRSNAPNKTFKQSTEDVLAEFGARSPCIVPVSTGHGGMPRDELHPSGRVILDIYTAARAYMIGLGNTAGETMSHIFELRPYDASVVIDAEDEKLPDADAFAYLFRSRQAMKVLAMLRYFTHEEIRVEYERSMASKNNASTDRPSCHRELRVSELQLVDGVERLALMLASVHVRAVPADTARRSSIARAVLGKLITHAHEDDASFNIDTPEGAWLAAHNRLTAAAHTGSSCDEDNSDDDVVVRPRKRRRCIKRSLCADSDSE